MEERFNSRRMQKVAKEKERQISLRQSRLRLMGWMPRSRSSVAFNHVDGTQLITRTS
jgi:hypothetical protein